MKILRAYDVSVLADQWPALTESRLHGVVSSRELR
jgi:hypothetical protein